MLSSVGNQLRKARKAYKYWKSDDFLKGCRGVIHVGANTGQERKRYENLRLAVLWIEPIPLVFADLQKNIARYPKQRALSALITDVDGDRKTLHVANNGGASSSILPLADHKAIWPHIDYVDALELQTSTLPTALKAAGVAPSEYDALVLDTQGSELMVLKGAAPLLRNFARMVIEAADFNAYDGNATKDEICAFLDAHGFTLAASRKFAEGRQGSYYDLYFLRSSTAGVARP